MLGFDQATIDAVADWRASEAFDDTERLVLEYTEALSLTPAVVDDELRTRVATTFSRKQVVELTQIIAWENARARFNRGFDLQPEGYAK